MANHFKGSGFSAAITAIATIVMFKINSVVFVTN